MNTILFHDFEWGKILDPFDKRSQHVKKILKSKPGDSVRIGRINAGLGKAVVKSIEDGLELEFPDKLEADPTQINKQIAFGHVRPLVMQRLFKDLTSLGFKTLYIFLGELSDKSYFSSSFWKDKEYERFIIEGLEQGGLSQMPEVLRFDSLKSYLETINIPSEHLAFDPRAREKLEQISPEKNFIIGPERGFSERELELLATKDIQIKNLGNRIMRTELVVSAFASYAGIFN